ncbi:MAG: hypothetical protein KY432_12340, partial [Acidobacteria bacterium]|nr:hypothetical protein [Acidobacteriota bacterium]
DAIVRRIDDGIFINVPKLVVGKMGWDEEPGSAEEKKKLGPRRASVDRLYKSTDPTTQSENRP